MKFPSNSLVTKFSDGLREISHFLSLILFKYFIVYSLTTYMKFLDSPMFVYMTCEVYDDWSSLYMLKNVNKNNHSFRKISYFQRTGSVVVKD